MNPRAIKNIKEADQLLKKAEEGFPSENSAAQFREAFDILNDYIEYEEPPPDVREFIHNLKLSYTRSALSNLNKVDSKDVDVFMHYLVLFVVKMKPEFEVLKVRNPELAAAYDFCLTKFKPQLDDIVAAMKRDT